MDITQAFGGAMKASVQAESARRIIDRNPAEITINRDGVALDCQKVAVIMEASTTGSEQTNSFATGAQIRALIFGVRGHDNPDIPDTDIQREDFFDYDGNSYRVVKVTQYPGSVQALAEVYQ